MAIKKKTVTKTNNKFLEEVGDYETEIYDWLLEGKTEKTICSILGIPYKSWISYKRTQPEFFSKLYDRLKKVKEKNRGRPRTELSKEVLQKIEALASQGLRDAQIADCVGIHRATFSEKKKVYPEIAAAIQAGKSKGLATVTNALFKRAKGYTFEETKTVTEDIIVNGKTPDGKLIKAPGTKIKRETRVVQVAPDVTAGIYYTKNRDPEQWPDRHNHKLGVSIEDVLAGLPDDFAGAVRKELVRLVSPGGN